MNKKNKKNISVWFLIYYLKKKNLAKNSKFLGRILGISPARAGFYGPGFRQVQVSIQVSNFGPLGRVLGGPAARADRGPGRVLGITINFPIAYLEFKSLYKHLWEFIL